MLFAWVGLVYVALEGDMEKRYTVPDSAMENVFNAKEVYIGK